MKKIRENLITVGISLVFVLSVCIAHAQAPAQAPAPAPAPVDPKLAVAKPASSADGGAAAARARLNAARMNALRSSSNITPTTPGVRTITPSSSRLSEAAAASVVTPSEGAEADAGAKKVTALKFDNTASDIVLMAYAEQTGKTLLIAPDVPKANITLRSQPDVALTADEFVEAIEVVLSMNGITLEPYGEKFVRVLARKTVRTEPVPIVMVAPEGGHPDDYKLVSQMIQLMHITIDEAKKAIEGFKKPDGMIQSFERTNSLLVTDIQGNVNRMLEIIKFIDQPIPVTEEVFTRTINFAKAEDIKKRLEEIVAEAQKANTAKTEVKSKSSGSPGITTRTTAASSISDRLAALRNRSSSTKTTTPAATPNVDIDALVSDADRGMVRGKVQILADERTNQLIIITRKENMDFFEKIINVLDVETTPDVKVDVLRLEYADAEEISTMLNDLIGNASSKKDDSKAPSKSGDTTASKSTSLADAARARLSSSSSAGAAAAGKSKLGQLSNDNIKILADKRTNALVMMGSIGDLAAITEIVKSMDIMLSQVLIETVVLEVALKNEIETGINWVQRVSDGKDFRYTWGAGNTTGSGAQNLFGSTDVEVDNPNYDPDDPAGGTETLTETVDNMAGEYLEAMSSPVSGLEYFMSFDNLDLDAVIKAAASDSRSRLLSSPILLTVDNKEASLEATETQYMYKGMRYMGYSGTQGGGSYEPDIEQRDVGLTVKVTPRISPNGNVIMTVEETFEQVLGEQIINGQAWPTVTSRKLSADVSVGSGETVVLGGLVKGAKSNSESGIPYLKDIPYIGKYLFGSTKKSEVRSELLVFLTPYVIETDEDMRKEARRRKDYLDATDVWTKGWSDSDLADPVTQEEMSIRLARKKALEESWREYGTALKEGNEIDARIIEERERVLKVLKGENPDEDVTPAAAGLMSVETDETAEEEDAEKALPEDESVDPQRPAVATEKKSWLKRLFSSE